MDANDALSSYDPYGTGVYKGVKVEATVVDESVRLVLLACVLSFAVLNACLRPALLTV